MDQNPINGYFPENISKGGMIQRNVEARKEVLKRLNIGGEDPLDIFFAKVILEEKEMHGDGVDYQSLHDLRPEDFDVIEKFDKLRGYSWL